MFIRNPIAEFMEHEDCPSVAQKLATLWNSMTQLECITANIVLLHNEVVYDTGDFQAE